MIDDIRRPNGPSADLPWLLRAGPAGIEFRPHPQASSEPIPVMQHPGAYELVRLLMDFTYLTTKQAVMLVGAHADDLLEQLREVGLVATATAGTVRIHKICDGGALALLSRHLGPAGRLALTGREAPLNAPWGYPRHDLLVVEMVMMLLAAWPPLAPSLIGGEPRAKLAVTAALEGHSKVGRIPWPDAVVESPTNRDLGRQSGRVLFEVTASARRGQLEQKFKTWSKVLTTAGTSICDAVVFVNACQPNEWARAERQHEELRRHVAPGVASRIHLVDGWSEAGITVG